MAIGVEAARSLVYSAAKHIQAHPKDMSKASAMCKTFATDMAMKVSTDAVQVMGGYGYMCEYPVEKMMRDAKSFRFMKEPTKSSVTLLARNLIKNIQNKEYYRASNSSALHPMKRFR